MSRPFFSKKRISSILLLSLLFTFKGVFAATPFFINYQGYLTNTGGTPQAGTPSMIVRVYDAPTGGTLLFEENEGSVTIANGYFTIPIGSIGDQNGGTPAVSFSDLSFNQNYYVTVEIGAPFNTGEMTLAGGTRSQMGVVPFAVTSYGALTSSTSTGLTTAKGKMYFDTVTNELNVFNGTSWNTIQIVGTTLSSLNGLTGVSQFFAVGQAGNDITITSTGTTHTLNIPDAGTASRGVVSTGTQVFAGNKTFSGTTTLMSSFLAGNVTLGTTTSNTVTVNGLFNSNLVPSQNNMFDLGSPSFYWKELYVDNINANTISGASSSISGTTNNDFTLNTDNATTDGQDMSLVFFRGLINPNAVIKWNSVTKRLESNMSYSIHNETPVTGTTTLTVQGGAGQGSTNLMEFRNDGGTLLSYFDAQGGLTAGTTTITGGLSVNGNTTLTNGGILTVGDKVIAPGEIGLGTSSPSGKLSIQNTLLDQVALLIYGSSSQTAPLIDVYDNPTNNLNLFKLTANGILSAISAIFESLSVTGQTTLSNASTTNLSVSSTLYAPMLSSTNATSTNFYSTLLTALTATFANLTTSGTTTLATGGGNVGVGTTTPGYPLDVVGNARFSGSQIYFATSTNFYSNTNPRLGWGVGGLRGLDYMYLYPDAIVSSTTTEISTGGSNNTLRIAAGVNQRGGTMDFIGGGATVDAGALIFRTGVMFNAVDSPETARLNASGNFGIGTSSPVGRLSVKGVGTSTGIILQTTGSDDTPGLTVLENGNVGIGITSPSHLLNVLTALALDRYGGSSPHVVLRGAGGSQNSPTPTLINAGIGQISGNNYDGSTWLTSSAIQFSNSTTTTATTRGSRIQFYTTQSNSATITERMRLTDDGLLGLGTTSPVGRFSVTGAGLTTGIGFQVANASNIPSLTVLDNGNVGIGTTSPNFKLEVNGIFSSGPAAVTSLSSNGNVNILAGNKLTLWRSAADSWAWSIYANAGNTLTFTSGISGSGSTFLTFTDSGAMAINGTVSTTGTSTFATAGGNVGIGTTTPTYKLDVSGGDFRVGGIAATTTTSFYVNSTTGNVGIGTEAPNFLGVNANSRVLSISGEPGNGNFFRGVLELRNPMDGAIDNGDIYFAGGSTVASGTYALINSGSEGTGVGGFGSNFKFYTKPNGGGAIAERMRIDSNGNVGIGTTTSGYQLSVEGNDATIAISNTGGSASFLRMYSSNIQRFVIDARATAVALSALGTSPMTFQTAASERMRIDTNGNIGIGTTTPGDKLHIVTTNPGDTAFRISGPTDNNWGGGLRLTSGDGTTTNATISLSTNGLDINNNRSTPIRFFTSAIEKMRLDSTGNLSIGTSTAFAPLHVYGSASMYGGWNRTQILEATFPMLTLNSKYSNKWGGVGYDSSIGMRFFVNSTSSDMTNPNTGAISPLIISNSGNIGIGTSSPLARLDITGNNTEATTSSELISNVTDSNFTGSIGNWTAGLNWLYGANNASHTAGATGTLSLANGNLSTPPVTNHIYQVTFTITTTATGTLIASFGGVAGVTVGQLVGTSGQVQVYKAIGAGALTFTPDILWAGTIDDISVKEIITSSSTVIVRNSDGTVGFEMRAGGSSLTNVLIGTDAGVVNTGGLNAFVGYQAGVNNTSGFRNTAIGAQTFISNTTGYYNTAIGSTALTLNTTGIDNTAIGVSALQNNTTGDRNTATGFRASMLNTTGIYNVANGAFTLQSNTTGNSNSAYGAGALGANTTGSYNSAFGYQAGAGVTTGSGNIFIGQSNLAASYNQITTGSNNISIGSDVAVASSTASNQLNIGNLLYGLNLNGTGTTLSTGNLGIGTTTPSSKLSVVGDIYVSSTSTFDGKVGIGTSDPTGNLQIIGTSVAGLDITRYGSPYGTGVRFQTAWGSQESPATSTIGQYIGTMEFMPYNGSAFTSGAKIYGLTATNTTAIDSSAILAFATTPFGGTNVIERMRIDQSGNVAIGTTSPAGILTVAVASSSALTDFLINPGIKTSGNLMDLQVGGTSKFMVTSAGNLFGGTINTSYIQNVGYQTSPLSIDVFGGQNIYFKENAVPKMTIQTGGNIGIGTTTPTSTLFVQGTSTTNPFSVASSTGSSLFTVLANGNVGVGSANPSQSFQVMGSSTNNQFLTGWIQNTNTTGISRWLAHNGGAATSIETVGQASTNGVVGDVREYNSGVLMSSGGQLNIASDNSIGGGLIKFYTGGILAANERMRISTNGNIGIGTTSASRRLSVRDTTATQAAFYGYGTAGANDENGQIQFGLSGQAAINFDGVTGSTNWYFDSAFNNDNSKIQFRTKTSGTPVNALTILGSGNIGISTSSPSATLSVVQRTGVNPLLITASSGVRYLGISEAGDTNIGKYLATTTTAKLDIYKDTSSSDVDIFRIISDVGSTENVTFRIDSDGDVFTDGGTTIGTPADLAENYPSSEPLEPGDVVSFASSTSDWDQDHATLPSITYQMSEIKRASYGEEAVGVISTRPGILLGGNTVKGMPVAFSGRVPVKVTNENGQVERGDALTVSKTLPGYAMKLTENGQSIGRAISHSNNATTSTILMIVENKSRTYTLSGASGLLALETSTSTIPTTTVKETLMTRLTNGLSLVKEYVAISVYAVTGYFDTVFSKQIYTNNIDTDTICLGKEGNKTCITKEKLDSLLLLDPNTGGSPAVIPGGEVAGTSTQTTVESASSTPESVTPESASSTPPTVPVTPSEGEEVAAPVPEAPSESTPEIIPEVTPTVTEPATPTP